MSALERDDRYWLTRGGVLEAAGRQDEALAAYDKAMAVNGVELARAQYAKGALLLARKDYEGARDAARRRGPGDRRGHRCRRPTRRWASLLFAQGELRHRAASTTTSGSRGPGRRVPP